MPVESKPVGEQPSRLTTLLWGPSGEGKTTLACTAPGKKLLCLFDPDGHTSVASRSDVDVIKFFEQGHIIAKQFVKDDPLGIEPMLKDNACDTVVVDSITNAIDLALDSGVANPIVKGSSQDRPAPGSYQIRNRYALKLIKNTLRLTSKYNKHCIFIGHEGSPKTNSEGEILYTTIALGGDLPSSVPIDFSEVWRMWSNTKGKMISIRTSRGYRPMKTRMFTTSGEPEFPWVYDPEKNSGMTIDGWWNEWLKNEKRKIPLPKAG